MLIVGLDAATKWRKFGYALGRVSQGVVEVFSAGTLQSESSKDELSRIIVPELQNASRALVAIDAPLGWPAAAGATFAQHSAGQGIGVDKDGLFHRATDDFVRSKIGKRPLEVGANLIARTAHSALSVLHALREKTGLAIPLAWTPTFEGVAAIEVYPAASLKAWGCAHAKYSDNPNARRQIAAKLRGRIKGIEKRAIDPADAFDAALCLLAALDFLEGEAWSPEDSKRAMKEGWIWMRRSNA